MDPINLSTEDHRERRRTLPMTFLDSNRQGTLTRLRSARGHLDAVIRMVEDGRSCTDVIHQLRAVQGGLDRSRRGLLEDHLRSCLPAAYAAGSYDDTVTGVLDAILGSGAPRAGSSRCHSHDHAANGDPAGNPDCCRNRSTTEVTPS